MRRMGRRSVYVRNCWYVAGWERELAPDALMSRTIMNEAIVLFRRADGTAAALDDRCSS